MSKEIEVNDIQSALSKTRLEDVNVVDEMSKSFISYAMAVNVSRAIPDVRDGLKPVHRRILYAMNDLKITHSSSHKKCARIVGEVLGKYHPHGDISIYEALVRMAQEFSIREPLVDGQGNFGSVDGDGAAAMRYTEAKLSRIASELVKDIDKETVDFYPNFDDSTVQPRVLPAKFPNLLVNGAEGIAVGMATSIPPHNLGEVIDATIALIDDPEIEIDDLVRLMPAPDFPTGAFVLGSAAVLQAYRTGRGGVVLRARAEIEEAAGRSIIVVTEIPYQVNKSTLIKAIAERIKDKRLEGISSVRDESDRTSGVRIIIELKKDANPQVVLNSLYKQTSLQTKTGITLLALHEGVPRVLNLKQILEAYVVHQVEVVTRKTNFLLVKAKEKEHILDGLVIALSNIDEVIKIIRNSKETAHARERLMEVFSLTEKQATAILDMRLARLTSLEVEKIRVELKSLKEEIADYLDILEKDLRVREIIKEELKEIKRVYGSPRRSELSHDPSEINIEDLINPVDIVVTMTYQGYIKRIESAEYRAQNRGGVGISAHRAKEEDFIVNMCVGNTHDDFLFFTSRGKVYRLKGYEIPTGSRVSRGRAAVNILPIEQDEKVTAFISANYTDDGFFIMATKNGLIKKTSVKEFESIRSNGKIAITLVDDDELIGVDQTFGKEEILIASSSGKCIRFSEDDIRDTGRSSQGVKSINLCKGERVVDMALIRSDDAILLTISEQGFGKRSSVKDYTLQRRAGKGVKAGNFTEQTGGLVNLKLIEPGDDVIIISDTGIMIRLRSDEISLIGRATKGVRLMRLRDGGKVVCLATTPHEDDAKFEHIEDDENNNPEEAASEDFDECE